MTSTGNQGLDRLPVIISTPALANHSGGILLPVQSHAETETDSTDLNFPVMACPRNLVVPTQNNAQETKSNPMEKVLSKEVLQRTKLQTGLLMLALCVCGYHDDLSQ
jgi:hypothetical protein